MSKQTIQELHADSITLYNKLLKVTVEKPLITYKELNEAIIGNTQQGARGRLATARRMMQREHNILFDTVIGLGLKRMTDHDVISSKDKHYQKIRRTTNRSIRDLTTLQDFDSLSNKERTTHLATLSGFKVLQHFIKPKQVKLLEDCVAHKQEQLSIASTIEAITGKKVSVG
jgi:hypothetical protein